MITSKKSEWQQNQEDWREDVERRFLEIEDSMEKMAETVRRLADITFLVQKMLILEGVVENSRKEKKGQPPA